MATNVTLTLNGASTDVTLSTGGRGATGATGAPGTTDYNELDNVPSEFPPSAHTHPVSEITPISSGKLVGRHGGGSGAGQEIGLDGGLEFQGANIRREALTGDVTAEAGSNATTIANDVVTNAKLANVPTATIKGRITAGTGDPEDLTPAQARTVIQAYSQTDIDNILAFNNLIFPDADALAYIAALTTAGATVTSTQRAAIDTFIKTGKNDGWYSSLKRLYLPIWASAAPNAIDMIGRTSGTFNGTVTHSAGFAQGNGSTGYFDTGFNLSTGGITNASAWMGALWFDQTSNAQIGAYSASATTLLFAHLVAPSARSEICGLSGRDDSTITTYADMYGIFSANRRSGVTRHRLRRSSGITVTTDFTRANAGTIPNGNFYFMARNRIDTSSVDQFSNAKIGVSWLGDGVSGTLDEDYTLAVKTLWETCTGLVLP